MLQQRVGAGALCSNIVMMERSWSIGHLDPEHNFLALHSTLELSGVELKIKCSGALQSPFSVVSRVERSRVYIAQVLALHSALKLELSGADHKVKCSGAL